MSYTLSLKNLKINKAFSEETVCFMATVCANGIPIAHAKNDGHGGCTDITEIRGPGANANLFREVLEWVKTLPERDINKGGLKPVMHKEGIDDLVDALVCKAEADKDLARHSKKGVCFRLPGEPESQYSIWKLKVPPTASHFQSLLKEHPTAIILNPGVTP